MECQQMLARAILCSEMRYWLLGQVTVKLGSDLSQMEKEIAVQLLGFWGRLGKFMLILAAV